MDALKTLSLNKLDPYYKDKKMEKMNKKKRKEDENCADFVGNAYAALQETYRQDLVKASRKYDSLYSYKTTIQQEVADQKKKITAIAAMQKVIPLTNGNTWHKRENNEFRNSFSQTTNY